MDDDFDDFANDLGADDLLDFELETNFRSRAYTWPSRPPTFPSPVIHGEPELVQSQLTPLRDVTEAEIAQLQSINGSNQNCSELPPSPSGSSGAVRKVASRRNAWGNLSYADLITKAIESSPEKRLTLSQIYAWMVANVPFFSDKGDNNSSAGWKNSIRHNLSLHSRFVRVQNEGTGKSSWWMLSSDSVPKAPRKRAGTMDAVSNYRRPGKKQLSGRPLKSARSTELHPSGSGNVTPSEEIRKPFGAVPTLNEPSPAPVASGQSHSFREYRHRSHSGESSAGSGCSPAFEPITPGNSWDTPYLSPEPIGLADVYAGGSAQGHHRIHDSQQSQVIFQQQQQQQSQHLHHHHQQQQQQHPMFMTNEAYAHGVPIHRVPSATVQHSSGMSPTCMAAAPNVSYPSSGGSVMIGDGCLPGTTNKQQQQQQQQVPVLSSLLHEKPRSSCLLGSLLMSGGNMSMQDSANYVMPNVGGDINALLPAESAAHPPVSQQQQLQQQQQQQLQQQQQQPSRRPFQMNQKLLMQLLANKPHLAARVQQLIEAKRRQQMAAAVSSAVPHQNTDPLSSVSNHSAMLEQLFTGMTPMENSTGPFGVSPFAAYEESFPNDLDLNLLDFEATSDIDCDIEQVIQHELAFGDKLDFTFDQLHLDEFASYP